MFKQKFNQTPRKANLIVCRLQYFIAVLCDKLAWVFIPKNYVTKYREHQPQM